MCIWNLILDRVLFYLPSILKAKKLGLKKTDALTSAKNKIIFKT